MDVMEEFRSNLLLLLHCRYPEGLPIAQLESEYKIYYQQDVKPNMMQLGHWLTWEQIFQQPVFREDFITFEIGQNVYIKANRKRSPLEMSLIAKLARHAHFDHAKKPEFQIPGCICCQQRGQYIINSYPEPIVVKVESGDQTHHIEYPHAMAATLQGTQGLNNNDLSKTLNAADKSQLHKADPNQPVFTVIVEPSGQVKFVQCLPTPQAAATMPSTTELFDSVAVHQAQVQEKDDSASVTFQVKAEPQVFKCSTPGCNQEFPDKQHQVDHERRCEMKRYPCTFPGCDRRFRNSKQRHTHVSSVHRRSEPGFKCSVPECTATFRAADKLKVHESRCRFKYVTLQQMAIEGAENHLAVSQNAVTEGIVINVPAENMLNLENCDVVPDGVSTVDMSLVKAQGN